MFLSGVGLLWWFVGCAPPAPSDRVKVIPNVVYGRVAGAALLLDVLKPTQSNGYAVIAIPGSGWGTSYPRGYDAPSLKEDHQLDTAYCMQWTHGLAERGYTVFVIDHRFAPEASATAIVEDARQALRFVRDQAATYGVDPLHIAAIGHSSGGQLASYLGTADNTDSIDPRVQAVVTFAAPFDLTQFAEHADTAMVQWLVSMQQDLFCGPMSDSTVLERARSVSPYFQVSRGDAPHMIHYSTDDPVIQPFQAKAMHVRLVEHGVASTLHASDHAGHNPVFDLVQIDGWLREQLALPRSTSQ